jgi:hypothetical protein
MQTQNRELAILCRDEQACQRFLLLKFKRLQQIRPHAEATQKMTDQPFRVENFRGKASFSRVIPILTSTNFSKYL